MTPLQALAKAYQDGDETALPPLHDLLCERGYERFAYLHFMGSTRCGRVCHYLNDIIGNDFTYLDLLEKQYQEDGVVVYETSYQK